ncbi:MAG: flagellar protein export ATPase FliI [Candidatus Calescibacterium sp.]|nr:flagellar protein export ATPase FliI [Candidatus Calescibacterium sp.]MCX7972125.1 flagellar protein export ATPase FliI [bacterium]MDW8194813.1 flagellar protein export ATPase FliI [Candidatus Calescibacterium sp.]
MLELQKYKNIIKNISSKDLVKVYGKVRQVIGLVIESDGPPCQVGEICHIYPNEYSDPIVAEVVGFKEDRVLLMPIGSTIGVSPGNEVRATGKQLMVKVGPKILGRILDGLGNPIDGKGNLEYEELYPIYNEPPNPFLRPRIKQPLSIGVRAIDALLTIGKGQRVGIFAGSGVGKSTTLSMITRFTEADLTVLCLVGERGRELRDFIERDLGEEGLKRAVVVVATSDTPALVRLKAAYVATAIAEYFRDKGKDVLLMMDSVTRFAMAQREIGLAIGEPPSTKGYTPSVFALLPKLMERPGNSPTGSITAIYTVLVEGDDMNEPIADTTRGILDGHIVLSRQLAHMNHYPAIDVLQSVSRLFVEITTPEHQKAAGILREILSTYKKNEDIITLGMYKKGTDPRIDYAIEKIDQVNSFLKQGVFEPDNLQNTIQKLIQLVSDYEEKVTKRLNK